jgi:hypothetical protein
VTDSPQPELQPKSLLKHLNPDGGLPYAPGGPSFSEPTLLTALAFIAAGDRNGAQPLVKWVLKNRNADGSMGLSREFPHEGLWNSPLLAITMHHLGFKSERDSAIEFILGFRSIPAGASTAIDLNARLVGWPWIGNTFGWVEPTSWALLSLEFAGKADHPRAVEGRRLLEDRCIPGGGWNYGNKVVFNHNLMPFWDTTALALLALGNRNPQLTDKNLDLLEKSFPEIRSLLSNAMVCLCLARFGRRTDEIRNRITILLDKIERDDLNFAHSALGLIALSRKRVLTP